MKIKPTPIPMTVIKKTLISIGENVKKLELLCIAGGNVK